MEVRKKIDFSNKQTANRQYILRSQSLAWANAKFSGSLRWVLFTFSANQAIA
jgi:hypothetical protein